MIGLIGKKMGMAQIFSENGRAIPVTYIKYDTNIVADIKTEEKDGYSAVVVGYGDLGEKATKTKKFKLCREFAGNVEGVERGAEIDASIFEEGDKITLTGKSKGKGFQGRVRLHNAAVARKTHGTKYIRHGSTGSIGITARSQKGLKMAGRMGDDQVTLHRREVVRVDAQRRILAVKGPVPGAINSFVFLKK